MVSIPFTAVVEHGIWKLHILGLNHRLHSSYENSVVEGTIEYLKDGTGGFDDYYPCRRSGLGDMLRVCKWLESFCFYA
jgi:hypothetical protein